MQTQIRILLATITLLWAGAAAARDDLPIPADEFVYCTTCHGVQLMGNPIIKAPRLSGMEAWYVEQQLKNFRGGIRGAHDADETGVDMQPMAAVLSDEQIGEAAAFVMATRSPPPADTVTGDPAKGKAHYSTCAACHGVDGTGNEALGSPNLTIPNDWYLVTQLKNFKNGVRGSHPADSYGMQMRASVQLLADDDAIMDVVSYINTLRNHQGNER
jgi:cytochrome c oxidase subunit 2